MFTDKGSDAEKKLSVEKKPCVENNYYYDIKYFDSARGALKKILQVYGNKEPYTLFLPAYIGQSPKEGSGIYDPVCELNLSHIFYSFTDSLMIDVNSLEKQLKQINGMKVFLFVHYFGYIDPDYEQIIALLRRENVFIIEDGAHALFTHLVDGKCGKGDCILYSFHKMLPFQQGGAVRTKNVTDQWWSEVSAGKNNSCPFYKYDLRGIAKKRKENALYWEELLSEDSRLELLRRAMEYPEQTPQSFPVLLKNADRYKVYLEMNRMNFGVISLYHTMIKPIEELNDDRVKRISDTILNLPVHQDIGKYEIKTMYDLFVKLI